MNENTKKSLIFYLFFFLISLMVCASFFQSSKNQLKKAKISHAIRKKFKKLYKSEVTDILIGKALSAFISTHIAKDSPYDRFVAGQDALYRVMSLHFNKKLNGEQQACC